MQHAAHHVALSNLTYASTSFSTPWGSQRCVIHWTDRFHQSWSISSADCSCKTDPAEFGRQYKAGTNPLTMVALKQLPAGSALADKLPLINSASPAFPKSPCWHALPVSYTVRFVCVAVHPKHHRKAKPKTY